MQRYFLTVDWCGQGKRGVFCSIDGNAFAKEMPHTDDDMWEILDAFYMVLNPESTPITEEELKQYNKFYPLAEFSNQYGIAIKEA